jgi:hypothetical protein
MKTPVMTALLALSAGVFFGCNSGTNVPVLEREPIQASVQDTLKLSRNINDIVLSIADNGAYESAHIGYGAEPSQQWGRYQELKDSASIEELIILTGHEDNAVRCYAFQALVMKDANASYEILCRHLHDTTYVRTLSGCIGSSSKIGDEFITIYKRYGLGAVPITDEQLIRLDSLLLYTPGINLEARGTMLTKILPKPEHYDRIKEILLVEKEPKALIALAKYHRPEDKIYIGQWLMKQDPDDIYFGLCAVIQYPDPDFLNHLDKIRAYFIDQHFTHQAPKRVLYFAIAQYKSEKSAEIIKKTLSEATDKQLEEHSELIFLAIQAYSDPIYDDLMKELEKTVDDGCFNNYFLKDPTW